MNPLLKGPRSLSAMCILCIYHTQQVQSHGTAGIRAPGNPKNLSVILGGNHFPLHIFLAPQSQWEFIFTRKEPSAFPKTAGKASAHVLKNSHFYPRRTVQGKILQLLQYQNRVLQRMGGFAVSSGLPQKSSTCEHPTGNLDKVVQATPCAVPLTQGQGDDGFPARSHWHLWTA